MKIKIIIENTDPAQSVAVHRVDGSDDIGTPELVTPGGRVGFTLDDSQSLLIGTCVATPETDKEESTTA
jgi:hypothetical protein